VQIVFAKAQWIGKKEDNPEEKELRVPASMQLTDEDNTIQFGQGLSAPSDASGAKVGWQRAGKGSAAADEASTSDEEGRGYGEAAAPHQQRPRCAAPRRLTRSLSLC
jgi:hypothetical protein